MGFNYEKSNKHLDEDLQWTAYSDLFTMLSVVFLLLYVTSSLRSGTFGVQKQQELIQANQELEKLRAEVKVFQSLSKDHLDNKATSEEKAVYEELMSQLNLLQDEAKDEKIKLQQAANENEKKEMALNKYQALVKSIVDANMVSQGRIKRREEIIHQKNQVIAAKVKDIKSLESEVNEKQEQLKAGEREVNRINAQLEKSIAELDKEVEQKKISKAIMEKRIAALKEESAAKLVQLKEKNEQMSQSLASTSGQLKEAHNQLLDAKQSIQEKEQQAVRLASEIQRSAERYENEKSRLRGEFEARIGAQQKAFNEQMAREQLGKEELKRAQAAFAAKLAGERKAMEDKMSGLNARMAANEKELASAKEVLNARRNLARSIAQKLRAAGIGADVDEGSGDVTLSFGDEYFDTGRSDLKPGMRSILENFMPLYAKSLFEDPRIANKISGVEIVGFASPTYKGKFIDPKSLSTGDRQAVNYNLDLSYFRARSIFGHIFDSSKFTYEHQRTLLPLVKVTGRSFLAEDMKGRDLAGAVTQAEYCAKFDCKKAQKVIIKFNMDKK